MNRNGFFKDLFEFSATASAVFYIDGKCISANRSFRTQLGLVADTPVEKIEFWDFFENKIFAEKLIRKIHDRNVIRNLEIPLYNLSGQGFPTLLSGRIFSSEDREYLQISFMDISRQKDLQQALRSENARIASLMENLSVGLFFVNRDGNLTNINRTMGNILHIDEEKLIGHNYMELLDIFIKKSEEPEIIQQRLKGVLAHVDTNKKVNFSSSGAISYHYELVLFPVRDDDGKSLGWGGLLQDITELKQQSDWKLELLSILSHDIRSPLATLKGHVNVLRENIDHWARDMVQDFLIEIDGSVDRLAHQVDRNLALTRVEGGNLGLSPQLVNLNEILMQTIERTVSKRPDVDIHLEIPENLPKIRADSSRMEEVITNLLDNAIRYSPQQKIIDIRLSVEGQWIIFKIRDQGKGISSGQQRTIFDKYVREEEGGSGLGLYICRKIIEAHGGQISLESPPEERDKGTEFTFSLPVSYSPPTNKTADKKISKKEKATSRGQEILVIEDEADFQVLLRNTLLEEGYEVVIASNGMDALDIMQSQPPSLILLDWMLPGMNGLAICRYIRRWSNVPIIVVTACNNQEELITALDAGADDYIIKPFSREELLARIRTIFRRGDEWQGAGKHAQFSANGLTIDYADHTAWINNTPLELSPTEFEILSYLSKHRRQVVTYEQLLNAVNTLWGETARDSLFVYISRLRKKIEPNPQKPTFIITRWNLGYVFMPD